MDITLNERRLRLQLEIDLATKLLEENINNASIKDYISLGGSTIPGVIHGVIDNPQKAMSSADIIARTMLSEDNMIRKLFKYFSILKQGYKIIINK